MTASPKRSAEGNNIAAFLDDPTYDLLLRRAASILRREAQRHVFEPGDLVHEAFLRIARSRVPVRLQNSAHLLALGTIVMRRIVVDDSRSAQAAGRSRSVPLDTEKLAAEPTADTMAVRAALARLADLENRLFRIVEMRCFGGFDMDDIASALDVSTRTVKRRWSDARERLHSLLTA